jgi:hypothetical protein
MPRVAVIPGDDAAPEAMSATLRVLRALDPPVDWDVLPVGAELARLPEAEREALVNARIDAADTVLFGSTNGTTPGILHMRWGRGTYANVRPIRWRPGFRSPLAHPEGIDYVIVRENLEDMYVGVMGAYDDLARSGLVGPRARVPATRDARWAAKVITREGTERVARFACELALRRRRKLTVSAKTNMLPVTDRWFCELVREVARGYPDLAFEQFIVDDMAHRLVLRPYDLDGTGAERLLRRRLRLLRVRPRNRARHRRSRLDQPDRHPALRDAAARARRAGRARAPTRHGDLARLRRGQAHHARPGRSGLDRRVRRCRHCSVARARVRLAASVSPASRVR